jgi:hypothetical protein
MMPKLSQPWWGGCQEFVAQEALLIILRKLSDFLWFNSITNMGASEGAETVMFLAPPFK